MGRAKAVAARAPGHPAPPAESADRLTAARRQLVGETAALRAAQPVSAAERARILADLATRLDALLAWLAGDTACSGYVAGLTELAAELRDCDQPGRLDAAGLDALWEKAIGQLIALAEPDAPAPQPETPGRPFWKRPR